MEFLRINPKFAPAQRGSLLLSEPYLEDMKFRRTVVLIGEHTSEGSVGFVLNRLLNITTGDVVPDLLNHEYPVCYGGPVEPNTLHFIHTAGELITGAQEITDGIWWGGDIDMINELSGRGIVSPHEFKFFIGYSGWAEGQLEAEIAQKAWWITNGTKAFVFDDDLDNMWGNLVRKLGKDYAYLADSPDDPQWN